MEQAVEVPPDSNSNGMLHDVKAVVTKVHACLLHRTVDC